MNPKNRIRYEDAIKGIKGYESSELKIADVIDNTLHPSKSISCKCQIPGCNHNIRYEYVLENKQTHDRIVAGSTCVWPTLGLSELETKGFRKYEKAVKDYHDMMIWKEKNMDVWNTLTRMREEDLTKFRPFWEEIKYCRLTDEDTEYIRSIDVDREIYERDYRRKAAEERKRRTTEQRVKEEAEYKKVLDGLDVLVENYPDNYLYKSFKRLVGQGFKLTVRQSRCVKLECNKLWYKKNIEGTDKDIMDECDDIVKPLLKMFEYRGSYDREAVNKINQAVKTYDNKTRLAWTLFRIKDSLVF